MTLGATITAVAATAPRSLSHRLCCRSGTLTREKGKS